MRSNRSTSKRSLEAVSQARSQGVTISIIGIQLDKEGQDLAEQMARLGDGRLYLARQLNEVDKLILEDYAALNA